MALYFVINDPIQLPNRNALEYHKTACLIWRMAGGAGLDTLEYCSDDDDYSRFVPVKFERKNVEQWQVCCGR